MSSKDYYEREMKTYLEDLDLAKCGMKTALDFIEFKDKNKEKAKKKVDTIIDNLCNSKNDKARVAKINLLIRVLKPQMKSFNTLSYYDITDKLLKQTRFIIRWTEGQNVYERYNELAKRIADEPAKALIAFANDYNKAKNRIEKCEKDMEQAAEQERNEARKSVQTASVERNRSENSSRPIFPIGIKPSDGNGDSDKENEKLDTIEKIQKKIDEKRLKGDKYLGSELEGAINKIEVFSNSGGKEVAMLYRFEALSKVSKYDSPTSRYNNIVEMGKLAVAISFNDLMYRSTLTPEFTRFIAQFEPHNVLERYDAAYKEFINYYNKLSKSDKGIIDRLSANNKEYNELFVLPGGNGFSVAKANQIKRVVNDRIINTYLENGFGDYIDQYNGLEVHRIDDFAYSLRHMSIEEIKNFYKSVIYNMSYNRRVYQDTDMEREKRDFDEKHASVQKLFAETIRKRLSNTTLERGAFGDKEKEEEFKRKEEYDLVAICKDIFEEEPLFHLSKIEIENVKSGYGKERVTSAETIAAANKRYHGMSKFKKVLASLSFAKLKELAKKDTLTEEEQERVMKMF